MLASVITFISALLIGTLGAVHLAYTFRGTKLAPRSAEVRVAMESDSPVISRDTTMWMAWQGFNASHSLGTILFGLVYGYLALMEPAMLFASAFLSTVGLAMLVGLLFLAKHYWFRVPFIGIAISLLLYIAGQMVARA